MGTNRAVLTITVIIFISLILCNAKGLAQSDFDKWKAEQNKEFQEYKDKFDKEFIEMLSKTWEEAGLKLGADLYEEKKPITLPKLPPPPPKPKVDNEKRNDNVLDEKIDTDFEVEIDLKPISLPPPKKNEKKLIAKAEDSENVLFENLETRAIAFSFYSNPVLSNYPVMFKSKLDPAEFKQGSIDNKKIAKFWDVISSVNHTEFVKYTLVQKEEMGLNDWGYILFINNLSKNIFGSENQSLVRLMNWFILTKAGYEVKIGYDQNGVYNLFTVSNNIFNTKYYTLDGSKFFPINFNKELQTPSSIFTYSGKHKAQVKKLDLSIGSYPNFNSSSSIYKRTLTFNYEGTTYNLPLELNKDVVTYFEYYPLTDLEVFFTASFSDQAKSQLFSALKPLLKDKTELEAVSILLRFVQTAFEYKTDQDQFDREKYMMPDEALFYTYSDCDDRSIIFGNLVRELVGLEVVGLRYSKHLAVAVNFNEDVEGDFHMSGKKKFTVADPTFINAPVGLTMTTYKSEKPKLISLVD